MKFLLIGFFGRTYMPYMKEYEKILQEENISYDVTCFERYETAPIEITAKRLGTEYTYKQKTTAKPTSKILPAFGYFRFVKKLIRRNRYDRLIVFTTMPAIFLSPLLVFKYKKRYIYDYRDYTYEKYLWFRLAAKWVMDRAVFVCFSSKGYLKYYPGLKNYLITHNISNQDKCIHTAPNLKEKKKLCIGFLGYVRYFDVNKKIIDALANSPHFSLKYVGSSFSDCDLQSYCTSLKIENVEFLGTYLNEEKPRLYQDIDIINSVYSLESPEVKQAVPNRIYDAALFKKPILVAKGTYLSRMVEKYDLGISIDPAKDEILQSISAYICSFDSEEFTKKCNGFLFDVSRDLKIFHERIAAFIRGE